MYIEIDARGLACPKPVINTKKELDNIEQGIVIVTVDNDVAKQNILKLSSSLNCESRVIKEEKDLISIEIKKGENVIIEEKKQEELEENSIFKSSKTKVNENNELIKKYPKGDEQPVNNFLDEYQEYFCVLSEYRDEMGKALVQAFDGIGTIKENKEADMNNDIIKYLLAKRTVNYFDLERKDITLPPWGMYLYPPILNNSLSTCDILRKVSMSTDLSKIGEPDEYLLVLTPSCDLVNEGIRNAKVEEVLCAKCFDKEVFSGDVRKAGKIESLLNSGVNKQWVALPAYKNICPSLTVDMKKLEIIPLSKVIMDIKELKENNTYLRICSVDSPFREQIIWNYMQTSCRPGVPDRNVTAWAKDIANIKK